MAIISIPYNLDSRDLVLLRDNPIFSWDKTYKIIQDKIRKDYCVKQRKICAYCNTEMDTKCNGSHLDHIVPKSKRQMWMYEPINLCLSCPQCNTTKLDKFTLSNISKNAIIPPRQSIYYTIIHPHFDNWNDHLFYEDDFFITASNNSIKGINTIEVCGLFRHLYIERRLRRSYTKIIDRIEILQIKKMESGTNNQLITEIETCINELTQYL